MIDFRSDNTGRAAPQILDALIEANRGTALGYGADACTAVSNKSEKRCCTTAVHASAP